MAARRLAFSLASDSAQARNSEMKRCSLINARSWLHWQMLSESVRGDRPAVREVLAHSSALVHGTLGGSGQAEGIGMIARQMRQQVAVMTFSDMFLMIGGIMVAAMLVLPFIKTPRQAVPAGAAH